MNKYYCLYKDDFYMKSHDYQVKEYEDDPKHLKMINQILNKLNNSKNIPWQYSYLLECAEIARSV